VLRDHILPRLGAKHLHAVTGGDVLALQSQLASMPARANRVVMVAMRMLEVARLYGHKTKPVERPRMLRENRRTRYLTHEEARRLLAILDSLPSLSSIIIRLLLLTGCRKGELLALRWSEVDFEGRCFRLHDSKTGARTVPVSREALSLPATLPRLGEFVFPGRAGRVQTFQRAWERIRRLAELEDFPCHDLRHSWASFAITAGVPLATVGHVLGHRHPATTQRYAHIHPEAALAATEKMAGILAKG
jgi:integrase